MTRSQFVDLVKKAESGPVIDNEHGRWEAMKPLEGLALHKERRMVSEAGATQFIRYQALQMNGLWDHAELESLAYCFRRVDIV
jgi:hypothetical protein